MDEDDEFEVTADMLIHGDVDDEQTLAEAEAQESIGDVEEEVADLQQESELPLEELLKHYGYSLADKCSGDPQSEVEEGGGRREGGEGEEEEEGGRREGGEEEEMSDDGEGGREGKAEGGEESEERDRGIKRGRIRDNMLEEDEATSSGCVKKLSIEKDATLTVEEISLHTPAHKSLARLDRDTTKLEPTNETISSIEPVTFTTAITGTHSSTDSSNHEYIIPPTSNSITSQLHDPTVPQHQSIPYIHPDSVLLGTNPSTHPQPKLELDRTLIGVAPAMTVAPLENAIENTPLGAIAEGSAIEQAPLGVIAEGSFLSDGEVDGSLSPGGSVFLTVGGHLLLGDPMLPAGRVGEGVGWGGGGEGREREGSRLLTGGGEREGDQLERSPRLTDGYSSDPQSSSDVQSHTPSSTSLQTSSFSSGSSSVSGGSRAFPPHSDIKSRLRPELPERRSMRLMANDEKVDSYFSAFFDDDEGDDEYFPVEEWKQEIRVGPSYQVEVANGPSQEPYSQQRDTPGGSLLWRPRSPEDRVVSYLKTVSTVVKPDSGINSWETEQAMKLLQECDHNIQRAVDVVQEQGLSAGTRLWSEEECGEFEEGLRVSGKDFFQLRKMVPSRSVKELVEFYYIWKKSKRYEDFIIQHGKIGKKKVTLQPGQVFDFMDNYLNMQDSTAPDLHYATTTVYAEHKKETV